MKGLRQVTAHHLTQGLHCLLRLDILRAQLLVLSAIWSLTEENMGVDVFFLSRKKRNYVSDEHTQHARTHAQTRTRARTHTRARARTRTHACTRACVLACAHHNTTQHNTKKHTLSHSLSHIHNSEPWTVAQSQVCVGRKC